MNRMLVLLSTALVSAASATSVAAASFNLADGNSSAVISDRNGATVWRVAPAGGNPAAFSDNIFLSNYFFRIGSTGGESPLLVALGTPVAVATTNSLQLNFRTADLAATIDWRLTGAGSGSTLSTLSKSVSFTNLGAAAIDFHLFDYTDFDIRFNPLAQADTATLVSAGRIITSSSTIPFSIDARVQSAPDRYQISDFITPYLQFFIDQDGPTTLPNTPALGTSFPATPGDTAFALQWSRVIAPGDSFTVSQLAMYRPTSAVPEPASWAYLIAGFGLIGGLARRRAVRAA